MSSYRAVLRMKLLLRRVTRVLRFRRTHSTGITYWKERAAKLGKRAVLNLGHPDEEYDLVTEKQKREVFPYFTSSLNGTEKMLLDFGCGPGRFTPDLARLIRGKAIGVEPIRTFLQMAPQAENVEYTLISDGKIPVPDQSMDVIWVCLVLGGIRGSALRRTVDELDRVLKKGGLLFAVENTSNKPDGPTWAFRNVSEYNALLSFAPLSHLHDYFDLGETISIMAGRKQCSG